METNLFIQISFILAITVSIAFIFRFLKQPLLVAYMMAGIVCGPLFLNLLNGEAYLYKAFSDFGVVLLLFIVGLELNFSYLKKIGKTSAVVGLFQFILNFCLVFLASTYWLDLSLISSIFLALASCFSSTIVILKLLNDKHDEESVYGRYTIGLMLIQDIISIVILFLLSLAYSDGTSSISFWLLGKILAVAGILLLSYKFALPKILDKIACSGEFLFIFTVAWCFGIASLMVWAGLSIELGAIIAGLTLGSSRYRPEIISRIKPLRDFFLVIFFVILGGMADFSNTKSILIPALILSAFILIVKPVILYIILRVQRFTRRNSCLSAATAVPLSEFGFIILLAASKAGYIDGLELSIFTIATIITIFISSYVIGYNDKIYNLLMPVFLLFGHDKNIQRESHKESFDAMVFGYHRAGWKIGNALEKAGFKFAAIDFNPGCVVRLKQNHIKVFFGDSSDIEFLKSLPFEKTKLVISTIPSPEDQLVLINYLKSKKKNITIICTLYNKRYLEKLYEAGADYVMLPHLISGTWMAHVISRGNLSHKSVLQKLRKAQAHEMEGDINHPIVHTVNNFS